MPDSSEVLHVKATVDKVVASSSASVFGKALPTGERLRSRRVRQQRQDLCRIALGAASPGAFEAAVTTLERLSATNRRAFRSLQRAALSRARVAAYDGDPVLAEAWVRLSERVATRRPQLFHLSLGTVDRRRISPG